MNEDMNFIKSKQMGIEKLFMMLKTMIFNNYVKNFVIILIVLIMKTLITMIIIMILPLMMNIEKMEVLEHYLNNQIEIITNQ